MRVAKSGFLALIPLLVFLILYLGVSLLLGDFYKVPISVAFVLASMVAVGMIRGKSMNDRIAVFSQGAAHPNVLTMIWIFVLAGAFARSAEAIGAIDATVSLTLRLLPGNLLFAGIFLAACFVSLSVGTSVGTIVALMPVAVGLAESTSVDVAYMSAIVVGGAFFGDNLSFISDTTIAATRSQGCELRDKFKVNFYMALPAALLVLLYYVVAGWNLEVVAGAASVDWVKIIPYLVVLATAIAGMNVMIVLTLGLFASGVIGICSGSFSVFDWLGTMGGGIAGMSDLIIVTLLAGGMLEVIRHNGGIDYIIRILTGRVSNRRTAELSIAALVGIANICTANNTIAIVTVGPIARKISERFGIDPRRSASLLDIFSCVVQGIIPYGAQMLMAAGLASVSPLEIVRYLYYPYALGAVALLAIVFRYPRKYS
jgi:Na+/H+ antiporter